MGVVMLQDLVFVIEVCALACSMVIQGSAVPPVGEGTPGPVPNPNVFNSIAPTPVPQPNGVVLQPPLAISPFSSAPPPSSTWPIPSTPPQQTPFVPPPSALQAPVPVASSPSSSLPPNKRAHPPLPEFMPPNSHQAKGPINDPPLSAIAPVSGAPPSKGIPESQPPSRSVLPEEPPSISPVSDVPTRPALPGNPPPVEPVLSEPPSTPPVPDVSTHPALPGNPPPVEPVLSEPPSSPPDVSTLPALPGSPPPVEPILSEPPSSPPDQNASPILAPPPRISKKTAPANKTAHLYAPVSHSPEAPSASHHLSNSAPPPHHFSKSRGFLSPMEHHHPKVHENAPAPLSHVIPPPTSGSSASASPISSKFPSSNNHYAPISAPSPASSSGQTKSFPKIYPPVSPPRIPKLPPLPPLRALPPPPPHADCSPMTCDEPLTYGPHESPCVCVLPIQVGLRLTVALYTFFPLVSELASEIAGGVFMKQSQVRIMGANAEADNPEKTIVLIDLLPLGEKFDDTSAHLTFRRFWNKQVAIKTSFFGDYDVLYVRYPGLPLSPPLPPSAIGIIPSKPYPGHDNNARTVQPLGVDISRQKQNRGLTRGITAMIILSCFAAVILLCVVGWVFVFRYRHCVSQPDPTPPITLRSHTKSSGIAASTAVGSGTTSPPFSLGSSMAAYTGSAKTFSSTDIERATDFFNESRVIGEGGFGRVYCGVLDDGTKVAMKILKRYDQQGGREFMAEVEMLSRLHHRNLVKLIGICVEDRTRCLVYELIPNGSVESHLHGSDKERSPLDWSARLKIALGAARALAYLHEDSSPRVIHRDFKASNILLEDDFTPKVSDFGLARTALDEENRHISTRVMGTFGYVAPEYAMTGHLLVKSDVYSYGVVLLELLTGRKPVDMSQPPGQENLVSWARPLLTTREDLESIIDQSIAPNLPFDSIAKVAAIASMCVQPEVSHRPFMGEVVQALKLICNECDETEELLPSRSSSDEDLSLAMEEARISTNSGPLPAHLLSPSTVSDYEYRLDVERDLSMSELLSSSVRFGGQDSESFRRHSSSGPLRTGKSRPLWKTTRRLSRGSVSEHGGLFRLWPGSRS